MGKWVQGAQHTVGAHNGSLPCCDTYVSLRFMCVALHTAGVTERKQTSALLMEE